MISEKLIAPDRNRYKWLASRMISVVLLPDASDIAVLLYTEIDTIIPMVLSAILFTFAFQRVECQWHWITLL